MRYAGIIKNDIAAGEGINVSFFTQGCPIHCKGCHNPQTWDFNGGKEFTASTLDEIKKALGANGIQRNLSIMGGEPLCSDNLFLTNLIIKEVKEIYPDIKIYIWTGYTYEELLKEEYFNPKLKDVLNNIDYLIDGPFIIEERDITLAMRGSRNQRVLNIKELRKDEKEKY